MPLLSRALPLHCRNMLSNQSITFVVPVSSRKVLEANFLSSPCLRNRDGFQVLIQENFRSAAAAFNDAIDRSTNNLIVFTHQDMVFPLSWPSDLYRALECLARFDPAWGVLGCWGATQWNGCKGYIYSNGLGILGTPFKDPMPVQTIDEIVLIMRKTSGLRFDHTMPYFHLHGADICLTAAIQGMKSYIISAFCIHNNHQYLILPKEFYASYRYMRRKWSAALPIQTPCIRITRSNLRMYVRRLRESYLRYIARREYNGTRAQDFRLLLEAVNAARLR